MLKNKHKVNLKKENLGESNISSQEKEILHKKDVKA